MKSLLAVAVAIAFAPMAVPHMHLLGKNIQVTGANAFARVNDTLIKIDDWNFNGQGFYAFQERMKLNVFDNTKVSCRFDNSAGNPRNPSNPLKDVRWGEGTEDEMCLSFLGLSFDNPTALDLFQRHSQRR